MKAIITSIALVALSLQGISQTSWSLIWSDEFSGTALNQDVWTYEYGNSGWGNNELQYYTNDEDNVAVNNGTLKITARQETFGTANYTSGRIITNNKYEFQYGKVECRMKMPVGQGIWPAFWMLGGNIENVSWPNCGEIDIMEHVNNEPMMHGTVHWFNNGHSYEGSSYSTDVTDYHIYGIIWDETKIQFFVDGNFYNEFVYSNGNNSGSVFQNPYFFLLNVAVGGNWPGYPDGTTIFPATMEVDYIRVFQQLEVGVAEIENSPISIYPTPCTVQLNVATSESNTDLTYEVVNTLGEKIDSGKLIGQTTSINTTSWSTGVYFVRIADKESLVQTLRTIKSE
jgi:beta-glucanase (GH16 family)